MSPTLKHSDMNLFEFASNIKSEEEPKRSASVAKVNPNVLFYCRKDYFTGRIGLLGQRGC